MYHQSGEFIWSVLVLVWGVAVLVLLGRCSYYLKQLLKKESDRKEP